MDIGNVPERQQPVAKLVYGLRIDVSLDPAHLLADFRDRKYRSG
jgi:hypothetical protein